MDSSKGSHVEDKVEENRLRSDGEGLRIAMMFGIPSVNTGEPWKALEKGSAVVKVLS